MDALQTLIQNFSRLPGIGKKSATRLAYHLLQAEERYVTALADSIATIQRSVHSCSICGNYTDLDPCQVCTNSNRDRSTICVVEQPQDIATIETTGEYKGTYHVLMGVLSPLDGVGPQDLRIEQLLARVRDEKTAEVIVALNPTVEGDTTALYLLQQLQPLGISVSRLASGLPVGGDLEYTDQRTIARSLQGRVPFSS